MDGYDAERPQAGIASLTATTNVNTKRPKF
jgi:hypothetical protein